MVSTTVAYSRDESTSHLQTHALGRWYGGHIVRRISCRRFTSVSYAQTLCDTMVRRMRAYTREPGTIKTGHCRTQNRNIRISAAKWRYHWQKVNETICNKARAFAHILWLLLFMISFFILRAFRTFRCTLPASHRFKIEFVTRILFFFFFQFQSSNK